jgi:zinc protease
MIMELTVLSVDSRRISRPSALSSRLAALLVCVTAFPVLTACAAPTTRIANPTRMTSPPLQSYEETLANGLKVIIKQDHRAAVVMTQIWYKVGSSDETSDETGLSHALEHMMFKGTPTVPSEEFSRINARFGGSNNAFTTDDYTGYYQLYPANRLGLALELEADRMQHLVLKDDDFSQEMRVVMEERRQRTDDNPKSVAYERFRLMAYPTSPLRYPVIGHMKNLEKLKLTALKRWYEQWYTPNNAVLIIVGDVNPTEAMQHVRQYFGDIPSRSTPPRADVNEFLHTGERTMNLFLPVQVPALYMAWNVPSVSTASDPNDAYALMLLQAVIDGGLSARLEQRLVREQRLLTAVNSSYSGFERGASLFMVTAIPDQGHTLAEARRAILAEIEKLKTDPITPEELARVRTNYLADLTYDQDSISGQAQLIGQLETAGLSHHLVEQLPDRLSQLSVPFLQDVAKRYLTADSLSTLYLAPEAKPASASTSVAP